MVKDHGSRRNHLQQSGVCEAGVCRVRWERALSRELAAPPRPIPPVLSPCRSVTDLPRPQAGPLW